MAKINSIGSDSPASVAAVAAYRIPNEEHNILRQLLLFILIHLGSIKLEQHINPSGYIPVHAILYPFIKIYNIKFKYE